MLETVEKDSGYNCFDKASIFFTATGELKKIKIKRG